jgi:hypothetical protein
MENKGWHVYDQVSPVYISRKIVQAVVNSTAFSWLNSLAMKITASKID